MNTIDILSTASSTPFPRLNGAHRGRLSFQGRRPEQGGRERKGAGPPDPSGCCLLRRRGERVTAEPGSLLGTSILPSELGRLGDGHTEGEPSGVHQAAPHGGGGGGACPVSPRKREEAPGTIPAPCLAWEFLEKWFLPVRNARSDGLLRGSPTVALGKKGKRGEKERKKEKGMHRTLEGPDTTREPAAQGSLRSQPGRGPARLCGSPRRPQRQ